MATVTVETAVMILVLRLPGLKVCSKKHTIIQIIPAHIAAAVIFVAGIDIIFVLRTDLEKTVVDQITVNIQLKAWFAVLVQLCNQFLFRLSLVDNTIPKALFPAGKLIRKPVMVSFQTSLVSGIWMEMRMQLAALRSTNKEIGHCLNALTVMTT